MPPENNFANTTQESFPPVSQPGQVQPTTAPIIPPLPKKTFPKIFLWGGIGVAVIILLFLVIRMFTGAKSSSSTITWWGLWEDSSVITPLISAYESQHQGVKITYVSQSQQDYRERLTSSLAKGEGPDIFAFHNSWVPMFRSSLDALPASVMNPADYAKTYYPIASSDLTSGSSIVGVPLEYDALTLFVNQDIFDKAGKTPPASWDDFRALAKQLTVKDDQGVITQAGAAMG